MLRLDLGQGSIAVISDDRATRAWICDRVRAHDMIPLPLATGLDAVLTLERTAPRLAIVCPPALGMGPQQILDFIADEYPAIEGVLLAPHVDAGLSRRVSAWVRDVGELDVVLGRMTRRQPRSGRALILATYPPLRGAVCDCITELGWEAVGVGHVDDAERSLSSGRFDAVVVALDEYASGVDEVTRLRRIAPGLPAILLSATATASPMAGTITVRRPSLSDFATALAQLQT